MRTRSRAAVQAIRTSNDGPARLVRGGGVRLLLAVLLLGLCWAMPSNAIPVAWFGVEEFDAASAPALRRSDSDRPCAAAVNAAADGLDRDESGPQRGEGLPAAVLTARAPIPVPGRAGIASAARPDAAAASYRARAPPRRG